MQVEELMQFIEDYAETRHRCGTHLYNAKTAEAYNRVKKALSTCAQCDGRGSFTFKPDGRWPFGYVTEACKACNGTGKL